MVRVGDAAALLSQQVGAEEDAGLLPRPRRRIAPADVGVSVLPGMPSGLAVHTRIQTCNGVSVTITSFGGGDWDEELDSFCDESASTDESTELAEE